MQSGPPLGSPTLVLVPTDLERQRLADAGGLPAGAGLLLLSGFGPLAAAARVAASIERLRPARVVLCGIAGTYDPERHPVGEAREFAEVALHGVGVGEGERFLSPPALGFPQWPGGGAGGRQVDDRLPLAAQQGPACAPLLLTTCAAADGPEMVAERRRRFPEATGEDMEAFGCALACALAGTPLRVVRGFSNVAGDRNPERWRIPAALAAARRLLLEVLDGPWPQEAE